MDILPIEDYRFSIKVELEAERLAKSNPAQLTDLHLRHLVIYDADLAHRAAAEREKAVTAEREKAAAAAFSAAMKAQETTPATTAAPPAATPDVSLDAKAYLQKHGRQTVTVEVLFKTLEMLVKSLV